MLVVTSTTKDENADTFVTLKRSEGSGGGGGGLTIPNQILRLPLRMTLS